MPPVQLDGLIAVAGQPDLEALDAKPCGQDAQHRGLIVHDEKAGRGTGRTILGRRLGPRPRQAQVEEPAQARDRKDLMDLRTQVANGQVPAPGEQLPVQADQGVERLAGDVFDVAEVEEQFRLAPLLGQGEQLGADAVERFFIQRGRAASEVNHRHRTGQICLPGRVFLLQIHP